MLKVINFFITKVKIHFVIFTRIIQIMLKIIIFIIN